MPSSTVDVSAFHLGFRAFGGRAALSCLLQICFPSFFPSCFLPSCVTCQPWSHLCSHPLSAKLQGQDPKVLRYFHAIVDDNVWYWMTTSWEHIVVFYTLIKSLTRLVSAHFPVYKLKMWFNSTNGASISSYSCKRDMTAFIVSELSRSMSSWRFHEVTTFQLDEHNHLTV